MFVPSSLSIEMDILLESMDSTFKKSVNASLISLIGKDIKYEPSNAIATIEERYALHFLTDDANLNHLVKELVEHFKLAC